VARDGTIRAEILISMLEQLDPADRVEPNAIGNFMIYGQDCYRGYLDLVCEDVVLLDKDEDNVGESESGGGSADANPRTSESRDQEGFTINGQSDDTVHLSTHGNYGRIPDRSYVRDAVQSGQFQGRGWAPKGPVERGDYRIGEDQRATSPSRFSVSTGSASGDIS
jgi:hypothetical protein